MLDWTGERFLPWNWDYWGDCGAPSHYEHLHRYAFAAQFVKGKKVLDLGCGEGYGSNMLSAQAELVVGIDIDEQTVNHAKSRYQRNNLQFIQGSVLEVPIKESKTFDVIVSFEALEHVEEHERLLSEVKRLLKDNGLFIASTPDKALIAHSPFHLKELYFEEFKALIRRYFKDVRFFGQKVYTGSNIWHIPSQDSSSCKELVVEKGEREFHFIANEAKKPTTFMALASDAELEPRLSSVSSWLVDVSDVFYLEHQQQVAELNSALQAKDIHIGELNGALQAKDIHIGELNSALQAKDIHIGELNSALQARDIHIGELNSALRAKDAEARGLETQIWQIQHGIVMQLLSKYQRVIEKLLRPGTRRRYYYELGLTGIRVILNEGWRSFFRKVKYWLGLHKPFLVKRTAAECTFETYAPSTSKHASRMIKKVVFVPGDEISKYVFTSCRYRVYNIIEGLRSRGIECYVCYEKTAERLEKLPIPDVAIIFRAALSENIQKIIDSFKQHGVPVVFDTDDLIFELESANYIHVWKSWSASQKYEYTQSFRNTIDRCNFATCPTDYLANRIGAVGRKTFVIPNTINKAQYKLAEKIISKRYGKKDKKIKIGYFSGTGTHDKDFLEAAEALCEILERYENTEFHVVGDLDLPEGFKRFGGRVIRKAFMPYLDMLECLFQMDINIAALEQNNPFNGGKSELKIFEAALVGVPTIASRTDSYSKCIADGKNGFLAGSKEEWVQKLALLVENKEIRKSVGTNARKDFIAKFYIDNVIDGIIKIYEDIISTYHRERSIDLDYTDSARIIPEPFVGSGGHRNIFHPLKLISVHERKTLAKKAIDKPAAVAISLVKNEGDIIAAWMSHICALFDMVYIVDHLSIDGTREFLLEMAKTRDNIRVFSFDHLGYYQAQITNQLAEIAAHEYPDSWIFPLDADEFLSISSRAELLSRIKDVQSDRVLGLHWKNCMPLCLTVDEEFTFASPCLIPPFRGAYKKLAIHSSAFVNKSWRFLQGNHEVQDGSGKALSGRVEIDLAELIHIPIRSLQYFALKYIQIYLAYDALPAAHKDPGWGFHWKDMIERVLKRGMLSPDVVREFAAHYGEPSLYSADGASIHDLLDSGWTRAPLDIAHLEPLPQICRHYKFLELAKEILKEHKNKKLEDFLRIVGTGNLTEAVETAPPLNSCANGTNFGSLPPPVLSEEDTEFLKSVTETELLSQFLSKAFTPHEDPALSAWESHIPFLFCLLSFMKPRRFVELGSYYGNCIFAACQASRDMKSAIECIAIDTWRGDRQTSYYGEDVFEQFTFILNKKYGNSGKYIRKTFDGACLQFEAGSIDLLHIDGLHTYEAVSHDFNVWLPKMSNRGIIMLHDTHEYAKDFGVWKFWHEVRGLYPSFEFEHGHGLGVLLVGSNPAPQVRKLFDIIAQTGYEGLMRFFFSHIGELSPIRIGQGTERP